MSTSEIVGTNERVETSVARRSPQQQVRHRRVGMLHGEVAADHPLKTSATVPLQRGSEIRVRPAMSVVIPAHNEVRTLARNLAALQEGALIQPEVIVVCNGCTDDTAEIARTSESSVQVIEIEQPSKIEAVRVGNAAASIYPRVHLDADVEISGASLAALTAPLASGLVLATAPRREVPRTGCSLAVRWYYDVWEQLPQVRSGLFGRGVIAMSEEGQARVSALPQMMSDDLAMSDAFDETERMVVDEAVVIVRPPRILADLVRRRARVATGNVQGDSLGVRRPGSATSLKVLARMALRHPSLLPRIPVFLGVALLARVAARRAVRNNDFATWQRDESSRQD